ncbi:MAG TPA: glutaredoxin family protein [Gammaproteobacteria bacterium]|nr:glutaredoxin family protein [Gammaproteobacteria bacterium]
MTGLTLYHRPGCHLCEQMLAAIYFHYGDEIEVALVNVDGDPALKQRYGTRIPVLAAGERVICEGRLDEAALQGYFHQKAGLA